MSATGSSPGKSQKLTPCHSSKNWCHHRRSRWNSWLRRMGWSLLRKQHNRSIMRRKKVRPGHTTLAAWCKWPIRDSSSCLLHHFRGSQEAIKFWIAKSFSCGRRATWLWESSSIPRTVSTVEGPIHLPGCRGRPSRWQTSIAVAKFCAHWRDRGGPAVMKSSR